MSVFKSIRSRRHQARLSVEQLEQRETPAVSLVKDVNGGAVHSNPREFVPLNNLVYFFATIDDVQQPVPVSEHFLMRTDGTAAGTAVVAEVTVDAHKLFACNGKLFFVENDGNGNEVWVSDGTAAGTRKFYDPTGDNFSSEPTGFVVSGNRFYYASTYIADNDESIQDREVFVSDGTDTHLFVNANTTPPQEPN